MRYVLTLVSQDDIKQHMPRIVGLLNGTEAQRKIVRKVFSRIISDSGNVSAHMSDVELLVVLHNTDQNVSPKQAIEGMSVLATFQAVFQYSMVTYNITHY